MELEMLDVSKAKLPKPAWMVRLSSAGDPALGQDPTTQLWGAQINRWYTVMSLAEASAACTKFIAKNDLGARNWTGGAIVTGFGEKPFATVAYNGSIFIKVPNAVRDTELIGWRDAK